MIMIIEMMRRAIIITPPRTTTKKMTFDFDCGLPTSYSNINNNRRNEDRRRGAVHSKRVTVNSLKQSLALSLGGPSEQAEQILQLGTDEAAKEWV